MIYVSYRPDAGKPQLIEIPEKRDASGLIDDGRAFAVLEAARQRMYPGVDQDPNWKHPNARWIAPPASHGERASE